MRLMSQPWDDSFDCMRLATANCRRRTTGGASASTWEKTASRHRGSPEVAPVVDAVSECANLRLAGFMTVGLNSTDEAPVRRAYRAPIGPTLASE